MASNVYLSIMASNIYLSIMASHLFGFFTRGSRAGLLSLKHENKRLSLFITISSFFLSEENNYLKSVAPL